MGCLLHQSMWELISLLDFTLVVALKFKASMCMNRTLVIHQEFKSTILRQSGKSS